MNAVSLAMGGLILLLLAGTQILDWPWLVTLVLTASAFGFALISRRIPTGYRVAQGIDARLAFHDTLSTAWFYSHEGSSRSAAPEVRAAQYQAAEVLAAGVDVTVAVPFAMPRSLYAMAGLGVVATSLFALRYAVSHSLDLRPPLASIVFDEFNPPGKQVALDRKKKAPKPRLPDLLKEAGLSLDQQQGDPADGKAEGTPASSTETAKAEKRDQAGGTPTPTGISVENKTRQNQEANESGEDGQENTASLGPPNSEHNSDRASSSRRPSENQENSSLMDKFRDAVANLMSRLKNNQKASEGQQMASAQRGRPGNQGQQQGGQKSPQGKGNQKAEGEQNGQAQGEEGDGARQPQSGSGKEGGSDADVQSSKDGKSGIGKEDGSKELKEAEQLAAMGKISEILGKRAQDLTGEVMVEVASSRQQLKTAYSRHAGEHSDTGGEIHRDEIPLAYQRYVQQYFEEVRKPAAHGEAVRKDAKR